VHAERSRLILDPLLNITVNTDPIDKASRQNTHDAVRNQSPLLRWTMLEQQEAAPAHCHTSTMLLLISCSTYNVPLHNILPQCRNFVWPHAQQFNWMICHTLWCAAAVDWHLMLLHIVCIQSVKLAKNSNTLHAQKNSSWCTLFCNAFT